MISCKHCKSRPFHGALLWMSSIECQWKIRDSSRSNPIPYRSLQYPQLCSHFGKVLLKPYVLCFLRLLASFLSQESNSPSTWQDFSEVWRYFSAGISIAWLGLDTDESGFFDVGCFNLLWHALYVFGCPTVSKLSIFRRFLGRAVFGVVSLFPESPPFWKKTLAAYVLRGSLMTTDDRFLTRRDSGDPF